MSNPQSTDPNIPADEQLEQIISQTEEALRELRAELAAHRELHAQYEAVDNQMPQLLNVTKDKWRNVSVFIDELTSEVRAHRHSHHHGHRGAAHDD